MPNLAKTHAALPGSDHLVLRLDVTAESDWLSAIAEVARRFGKLDVLVNNAGWGDPRTIFEITFGRWWELVTINLDSVFLSTRHALPLLEEPGNAAIVNISSIRGFMVGVGSTPYNVAKAGIHIFSKASAIEYTAKGGRCA